MPFASIKRSSIDDSNRRRITTFEAPDLKALSAIIDDRRERIVGKWAGVPTNNCGLNRSWQSECQRDDDVGGCVGVRYSEKANDHHRSKCHDHASRNEGNGEESRCKLSLESQ